MADSAIQCPVTPENAVACPATPERLKSPEISSSSGDDEQRTTNSSSPPPKCAICLGNKCKNKCFTDSCLHQFCFKCLLEWSKIKAECPLCKQSFKSIIHNVKSIDQFEEYLVQPSPQQIPPSVAAYPQQYQQMPPSVYHRLDFLLSEPPRFTYSATLQVRPHQGDAIQQLFLHQSDLTERYSREYANDLIPYRQHAQEWRQYIYDRELYALPLADITGRVRECSAAFYRANVAQIHRLVPWLNRELVALLRGNAFQIQTVMTDMQEILITNDITSEDFRQYMRRYCRNSTNHFIHEFLNYARSPYDMIGYDRNVRYTPYFNSEPQLILSSSDDDQTIEATSVNDDVIRVTNPSVGRSGSGGGSGRTQFTIETRSAHSTVIVTGSFGGGSSSSSNNCNSAAETATATTTTTTTSSSQSNDTPQPISNRRSLVHQFYDQEVDQILHSVPLRNASDSHQQQAQTVSRNISLSSDTDSDECRFVLERKPPHLRTPEMVSLGSDSDSDVVYIETNDKSVPPSAAVDSGATNRSKKFRILQSQYDREDPPPGVFEPSADDQPTTGCPSVESSDNRLLKREEQPSTSTSSKHTVASATVTCDPNINYGASTSNTIGDQPPIKMKFQKYYAKPKYLRLNRTSKSIFDSSSSNDSTESESSHEEFKLGTAAHRRKRKPSITQKRKSEDSHVVSKKRSKRSTTMKSRALQHSSDKKVPTTDKAKKHTKKSSMKVFSKRNFGKPSLFKECDISCTSSSSSSLEQSSSSSSSESSSVSSSKSSHDNDNNNRKLSSIGNKWIRKRKLNNVVMCLNGDVSSSSSTSHSSAKNVESDISFS